MTARGGYRNRDDAAPDGLRRTYCLRVPMSPAEHAELEAAAESAGEGLAEYARTAIAERAVPHYLHTGVSPSAKPVSRKPRRSQRK